MATVKIAHDGFENGFMRIDEEAYDPDTHTVYDEAQADTEEVEASPAAAELADEHGIDLGDIEGTGEEGRVLKSDVEDMIADVDSEE